MDKVQIIILLCLLLFASRTLRDASPDAGCTPIMGQSVYSARQIRRYIASVNPTAPDYVDIYFQMEKVEGVRADVAIAQALLETNHFRFGGVIKPEQNNFCGLGAVGHGASGLSFRSPQEGIRAQMRHLRLYATYAPHLNDGTVDPRGLPRHLLGTAPCVEDLAGKWSSDPAYSRKILRILRRFGQF